MSIVLIGPWCAGKSTLGKALADTLGCEFVDLDELTPTYGARLGWSVEQLIERNAAVGMLASEREWEYVRAYAVERVIADYPSAIISFGASYTSYLNEEHGERVRRALNGHTALLVVSSLDPEECESICRDRAMKVRGAQWVEERSDFPSWRPTTLDSHLARSIIVNQDDA